VISFLASHCFNTYLKIIRSCENATNNEITNFENSHPTMYHHTLLFPDEPRFCLESSDRRVGVIRRPNERYALQVYIIKKLFVKTLVHSKSFGVDLMLQTNHERKFQKHFTSLFGWRMQCEKTVNRRICDFFIR
jgi:hypothetical protein